jgi:lysophospholipid acyltransferase (LPLAT)-like uncharacterized protein
LSKQTDNIETQVDNAETHVVTISGWKRLLIWPLGVLVRLWCASIRFDCDEESERAVRNEEHPLAFILWHNRLFLVGEIFKRYRRRDLYALVSASKDGAWLAAFFDIIGIRCVRGSSSYNARESVGLLVNVMRQGCDIGITPDGPRGPVYDFKGGGVIVARRARAAALLLGIQYGRAKQLRSWDRFYLPLPFSRIRLRCELVTPGELRDRALSLDSLGKRLRAISPDGKLPPGKIPPGEKAAAAI